MTTTLTLGDVLIHILIFFGGAFALWLLQKCRLPISDYWARRSISSRRKRIDYLKNTLTKYETDFSDTRLFIGRIVSTTLWSVTFFNVATLCIGLAFIVSIISALRCDLHTDCVIQYTFMKIWNLSWLDWDISADKAGVLFMIVAMAALYRFFVSVQMLLLEISPDKYRARFSDRIARLRVGIPES
jgi:hypothetical protein